MIVAIILMSSHYAQATTDLSDLRGYYTNNKYS